MKKAPLLLLVSALIIFSCKKPQSFEYRDIKNIKIDNWQAAESKVAMDLIYFNPNNYGVNLKTVDCDIYIDSAYVGKFHLDTLMRIPRNAEFTLPARMDIEIKKVFNNAINVLLGKEVLIGAKGTTRVGKGGFYVTVPFSYEGMHKLSLF